MECLQPISAEPARRALSRALGLSESEVQRYLDLLVEAKVLTTSERGYVLAEPLLVDTGATSRSARNLAAHWSTIGAERARSTAAGDTFSFNVFSIARADLKQLSALQHEYFQKARALIARSPPETVAVMSLQLFEFDVNPQTE